MSELVKTFSFDLQRFAISTTSCTLGDIKGVVPATPSSKNITKNGVYWSGTEAELANKFNDKMKITATLTKVEEDKDKNIPAYWTIEDVTAVELEGSETATFTAAPAALKITNLGSATVTLPTTAPAEKLKLVFNGATDKTNAKLTYTSDKAVALVMGEKGSVSIPALTGTGLTVGTTTATAYQIDKASTYTVKSSGSGQSKTYFGAVTINDDETTVTGAGDATQLILGNKKIKTVTIGTGNTGKDYKVNLTTGTSWFTLNNGAADGFNFVGKGDGIVLDSNGAGLTDFTYGKDGTGAMDTDFKVTPASGSEPVLTYDDGGAFTVSALGK